ncbi:sensor domain-containing diguanylate cyclase [Pseudomonas agarici]|uniref:sensor domain-containing diguanylate cyclase n=1 Tax=Pseudomonas agarici TaxID=46677 RepID=UPI0002DBC10D|nr:diguanylate cyclase [Pseudomonas agarici]NWB92863.1 diguanylate cyclase [Pseudomonas agarici]NWC09130.1 diguanylate cyclase [Pseudomonas agarici]SEK33721.1 diguanylate cyclase (GGDEF) domain-containing protein [Pseudomonas agarici]
MSSHPVHPKILGFISEDASAWLVAVLALLVGGLLTLLLSVATRELYQRQLQLRFELLANERFSLIEERFEDQVQRLDGLRRFFVNSDSVTRQEFEGYTKPLLLRTQAYSWAPWVKGRDRESFERLARAQGLSGFSIRELNAEGRLQLAAVRDEYVPVLYSETQSAQGSPLGYDLLEQPLRRITLERARDSGTMAASQPLNLVGVEQAYARGLLLVAPITVLARVEQPRPELEGYVMAVISMRQLVAEGLPEQKHDNLSVRILDLSTKGEHELLYQSPNLPVASPLSATRLLRLADREYQVDIRPCEAFIQVNHSSEASLAVLGAMLSVLLSVLLYNLVSQRQRALELVEQRTSQLQVRDRLLEKLGANVPGGIYQYKLNLDGNAHFVYASAGTGGILEVDTQRLLENAEPAFERVHPDDLEPLRASIRVSAERLSPWREEFRVVLPMRGLRWLRGEATPERLPTGEVLWHGYLSDITDLKRVEEELRALSVTDSLTGIYNRRYFQERLKAELARAQRGPGGLAVIMLDIDHFKRINDQYGHAEGDRVLKELCGRISHRLRRTDVFCRLGGEEFMVLCPNTDAEQARKLALELWQGLRNVPFEGVGWVTASFGIAGWRMGEGADALLLRADSGVYAAKQDGRDRVMAELD